MSQVPKAQKEDLHLNIVKKIKMTQLAKEDHKDQKEALHLKELKKL